MAHGRVTRFRTRMTCSLGENPNDLTAVAEYLEIKEKVLEEVRAILKWERAGFELLVPITADYDSISVGRQIDYHLCIRSATETRRQLLSFG